MLVQREDAQNKIILYTMEDLVPKDSLFRKIDKYIDFDFIYDEVRDLYCAMNGRPCIDPVVLFKIVFIEALGTGDCWMHFVFICGAVQSRADWEPQLFSSI